jgi:hypothetical protein
MSRKKTDEFTQESIDPKDKRNKKKPGILPLTTVVMLVVAGVSSVFAWYQIRNLETGVLDVCATQQDAYVQLVLDQINLKENRDDEEIIQDILSTLDSSSNKYWTFSKDRAMLFVKDVTQTNRYKGLTAGSYYDSESAQEFLENLQVDRVIHRTILLEGKEYVASGVAFCYGEDDYRLCLLTNRDVLLNNNKLMESEIELVILIAFILITLLSVSMLFARSQEKLGATIHEKEETINRLQGMVGELNEQLSQKEQYDTRYQLWSGEELKVFLEKLQRKHVDRVVAVKIYCRGEDDKEDFLKKASILLDRKVLRFAINEHEVLLLFLQYEERNVRERVDALEDYGTEVGNIAVLELSRLNLDEYIQGLNIEVQHG